MYYLGPTIGVSLGGRVSSESLGPQGQDLTDLKSLDFGLALGAGAGFKVGGRRALTELRYTAGFGDIYDREDNLESIHQVFSLTADLAF